MCLHQILRSRRCLLEVAQESTPAAHGRCSVDGERGPAYCAALGMTASELTPLMGESDDGSVEYEQSVARVVGAELERSSDGLHADFFRLSRKWSKEGETPTAEEIEQLETRLSEAENALRLLKEVVPKE